MKPDYYLKALHFIAWVVFVGVSIEAGGFLTNTVYAIFFNHELAGRFWNHLDLSKLYQHSQSIFVTLTVIMSIVAVLRAMLFYQIVMFFYNKNFSLSQPFSEKARKFVLTLAYTAFGISIFSMWGQSVAENLVKQNVQIPDIQHLRVAGGDVWLFMGVTLLVIAQIFKRGIELQTENDLTV